MKRETDGDQTPCVKHRIHITTTTTTGCFNNFAEGVLNSITLSISDVKDALSKASMGTGIDLIPGSFLRFAADDLAFHVYKLFEGMLSSAGYPEQ